MTVERIPVAARADWLALRARDLTASDLGAWFGCDPRRTPYELCVAKLAGEADRDSDVLRRGRWQEAAVLEMLADERPEWRIERPRVYLRDTDARLGSTPDAVAILPDRREIIVECKSVTRSVFDTEWQDGSPLKFQLQTLANTMLWGASAGVIAVLVRDAYTDEPVVYDVDRHPAAEAKIVEGAREFWRRVDENDLPPPDFARDGEAIARLFGRGGGEAVDLSAHNRIGFLCEELLAWRERGTTADRAKDAVAAEIRALLGDADSGLHPDFNISARRQKTGGFTVPAGEARVLRVTRKGKKSQKEDIE